MLVHLAPTLRQSYSVTIARQTVSIPNPLSTAGVGGDTRALQRATGLNTTVCPALTAAIQLLKDAPNETEAAAAEGSVRDAIRNQQPDPATCPAATLNDLRSLAEAVLALTTTTIELGELRGGERLVVLVARPLAAAGGGAAPLANAPTTLTWTYTLETPAASGWITTFGVLAIPQLFMPQRDTYLKTSDGSTTVEVTDKKPEIRRDAAITFAYNDREHQKGGFAYSPIIASVGLNATDPSVAIGTGTVFRDQVVFGIGIAVHSQLAPKREYEGGGVTAAANVTSEQLTRSRIAVNPVILISLRLDRNIFSGGQSPR